MFLDVFRETFTRAAWYKRAALKSHPDKAPENEKAAYDSGCKSNRRTIPQAELDADANAYGLQGKTS